MNPLSEKLYFKIGEVSNITGIKPYVLRYWEDEFPIIDPVKTGGKHRLYRKKDIENIMVIKKLLYEERLTIAGAKKKIIEMKDRTKKDSFSDTMDLKGLLSELIQIRDFLA
ncbi:MAG TPA: MerR family transcriptional regulator [bacterium]